jgi:hypothetical protein
LQKPFDPSQFRKQGQSNAQYERQLRRVTCAGKEVDSIEAAVGGALANLNGAGRQSFVIYGEPQSGKTEMMICLTAKLLDSGRKFVLHLLNDSVDLLGQNLGRFQESGLAPAAQNYTDILDPAINIKKQPHIIFCKKNARDLQKLINKIGVLDEIVIVDDEADFASPNSKINQSAKTKINELITTLLGTNGDYVGVTATPARLDLNNTFDNDNKLWVSMPPHSTYTGQDIFFPIEGPRAPPEKPYDFLLTLLPDTGDEPRHARRALFGFLVNVAYLNLAHNSTETNYSMLIHTSGKKADHKVDWDVVRDTLAGLSDETDKRFDKYVKEIWDLAAERYSDLHDPSALTGYIVSNITRNAVILLNSDRDFFQNGASATRPSALFTIIIGGNIVSRGVTFENLLSMFFTRDVKQKIQQDTYIQRARMFGSRGKYLKYFELTIPRHLYADWHRCFVFHKLALEAIKEGMGSPVWLSDTRIAAVAASSIDKSTVDLDKGEMAFRLFDFHPSMDEIVKTDISNDEKMNQLSSLLGDAAFPSYLRRYITRTSPNIERSLAIHVSSSIAGYTDATGLDKDAIERKKGFMGKTQLEEDRYPEAIHHLKIFHNAKNKGRLFYKFNGSIQFIKNIKNVN